MSTALLVLSLSFPEERVCIDVCNKLEAALQQVAGGRGSLHQPRSPTTAMPIMLPIATLTARSCSSIPMLLHRLQRVVAQHRPFSVAWTASKDHDATTAAVPEAERYPVGITMEAAAQHVVQHIRQSLAGLADASCSPRFDGSSVVLGTATTARQATVATQELLRVFGTCTVSALSLSMVVVPAHPHGPVATCYQLGLLWLGRTPARVVLPLSSAKSVPSAAAPIAPIAEKFERNMSIPPHVVSAAIQRAKSWIVARRAMASLPKSYAAWSAVLRGFAAVRVPCDFEPLIAKLIATGFLQPSTTKTPDPTGEKIRILKLPAGRCPSKRYRRLKTGEKVELKEGESIREFEPFKEVPAFEVKVMSSSSAAEGAQAKRKFDPPVPTPQLGDVDAFSAKIRRCLKHAAQSWVGNCGDGAAKKTVTVPQDRFRKLMRDISMVRATVPVDDVLAALIADGTLVRTSGEHLSVSPQAFGL